eukprot:SAG11_NODE_6052_length_1399_cov_1.445385_1_plen_56_part_00
MCPIKILATVEEHFDTFGFYTDAQRLGKELCDLGPVSLPSTTSSAFSLLCPQAAE